jgi:hypothetical protein
MEGDLMVRRSMRELLFHQQVATGHPDLSVSQWERIFLGFISTGVHVVSVRHHKLDLVN